MTDLNTLQIQEKTSFGLVFHLVFDVHLIQASSVQIDPAIPVKRYFRSSLEMVRMAKAYYSEGNLESAFVLYQKYLRYVHTHHIFIVLHTNHFIVGIGGFHIEMLYTWS